MDLRTRIFTYFKGTQIGRDARGNRYFSERRPNARRARVRRWVIYPGAADPSSVPAEWRAWLHYTTDAPLEEPHLTNAISAPAAYRPPDLDHAGGQRTRTDSDDERGPSVDPPGAAKPVVVVESCLGTHFTLVRHSGYAVGADPAFDGAVEVREVTLQQLYMVRAAGGAIFATREAAMRAEDAANYPSGSKSGGGQALGQFSSLRLSGAEIYVPPAMPARSRDRSIPV